MEKDIRFWLTTFFEKQEQTRHHYKSFQREIENNGCFIVKADTDTVKVYTPELAVIFTSKELPARNMNTRKETTINGWEYLKTYIEAYKEGEQYFETEFKVSPNTLYGANAEQYVRDIHLNFFHVQHTGINEGWGYVKKKYPIILTHEAVKEFGYYSGIVNKVEEQVKKYPRLFATFDKCEHNLQPQQTEKPKPEPKVTELSERIKTHFGFFNRNCPRKHKQILNDTDFGKLIEWTIWYFENDFKVPEISEPIKVVNTNKTFVQLAFRYLFKELHKSSPYPETLFEFYQSAFNPYSQDKKSNFEAVKNNDEVKKLMRIDY
jgi:hypothetical protein